MRKIKYGVALLGCGTVGKGVFELLTHRTKDIQDKYGFEFEIRKILVRDEKKSRLGIGRNLLTTRFQDVLDDEHVDLVIEVMGGEDPAKQYLMKALDAGRHVITANKTLMGCNGEKLVERARRNGKFFGFSAAVTGFHQLIPSIVKSIMITELVGIFNGTTNYILTQLAGKPFDEVLKDAIRHGYAEADHRNDTEGDDTRNKLVMAIRLAFGVFLGDEIEKIWKKGINEITKEDIQHAAELGYTVKLLGVCRLEGSQLLAYVAPALVPQDDPLARIQGVDNAILVRDKFRGVQGMSAAGAGKDATAMAIFSDLVSMARGEEILWPRPSIAGQNIKFSKNLPPAEYYVRLNAENQPGVLAKIGKHFARFGINIKDVSQRSRGNEAVVSVVFVLGSTPQRNIQKAIAELIESKVVVEKPAILRIERSPTIEQEAPLDRFADKPVSARNTKMAAR